MEFDFIAHRLLCRTSRGDDRMLALRPRTVADLYDELMQLLAALGIHAAINTMPNEMPDPCPFPDDGRHSSYDAEAAHRFRSEEHTSELQSLTPTPYAVFSFKQNQKT